MITLDSLQEQIFLIMKRMRSIRMKKNSQITSYKKIIKICFVSKKLKDEGASGAKINWKTYLTILKDNYGHRSEWNFHLRE